MKKIICFLVIFLFFYSKAMEPSECVLEREMSDFFNGIKGFNNCYELHNYLLEHYSICALRGLLVALSEMYVERDDNLIQIVAQALIKKYRLGDELHPEKLMMLLKDFEENFSSSVVEALKMYFYLDLLRDKRFDFKKCDKYFYLSRELAADLCDDSFLVFNHFISSSCGVLVQTEQCKVFVGRSSSDSSECSIRRHLFLSRKTLGSPWFVFQYFHPSDARDTRALSLGNIDPFCEPRKVVAIFEDGFLPDINDSSLACAGKKGLQDFADAKIIEKKVDANLKIDGGESHDLSCLMGAEIYKDKETGPELIDNGVERRIFTRRVRFDLPGENIERTVCAKNDFGRGVAYRVVPIDDKGELSSSLPKKRSCCSIQ